MRPDARVRKRLWDISQALRPSLPVWPGDTAFAIRRSWRMEDGSPVNVSALTMSTHSGAHADAPLHYAEGASDIASLDLEPYLGLCEVIDCRAAKGVITPEDIGALAGAERVLLRSYKRFPQDRWDENFTAIAPETIDWLAARGVRLVGIDSPSIDPQESKTMDAHKAILRHDMRVLEGLVLDDIVPGLYELIALPLRIEGGDAAPVRAVLRER